MLRLACKNLKDFAEYCDRNAVLLEKRKVSDIFLGNELKIRAEVWRQCAETARMCVGYGGLNDD